MFNSLTQGIYNAVNTLFGTQKITAYDINKMTKTIKKILVSSDVSLNVVNVIIERLNTNLLNAELKKNISSKELVIKEMENILMELLTYSGNRVSKGVIVLCGLQGQGKTTTAGKLANYFKQDNKKCLLVSLDFYRPAAIEQLEKLANEIGVEFLRLKFELYENLDIISSKASEYDAIIVDTAGRASVDEYMMNELKIISDRLEPKEMLYVSDAMQGQNGVEVAKQFASEIKLTGLILTKFDSNASTGSILSIQYELQLPIKMLGVGEKINKFEEFRAEKIVNRILDKGDVQDILNKVNEISKDDEAQATMKNMESGSITLNDYLYMINTMKKMGGMKSLLSMLPGAQTQLSELMSDERLKKFDIDYSIICSMTKAERKDVGILNDSRKIRIANGSGRSVNEVTRMIKDFKRMKGQIKGFKNFNINSISKFF